VTTRGVLNRVVRSREKDQHQGLILLGGPSQHYQWSDISVMNQISNVIDRSPDLRWTIGTSRRTPASMTDHWERHGLNANLVLAEDAPRDWLLEQYATAETIWVTDDSVSMTYEAVTSGSRVGLIELPPRRQPSRVTAAIDALVESSDAVRYSQWKIDGQMPTNTTPLAEADRCAEKVLHRLIRRPG